MRTMPSWIILTWLAILAGLCCTHTAHAASFFGASHVSVALQEARSSMEVSLRIKTHRPDALLLLAAGSSDYFLVVLEGGALRVRINVGAGESELSSPQGLRLDDLAWHQISIDRVSSDLTLTIDDIHTTRLYLPGRFHELNIHYGVFVGGLGDFTEVFLGLLDNFRGCMDKVMYNGLDVLKAAREEGMKGSQVYGVEWGGCAEEFDAPQDSPISFIADGSYVAFQESYSRTGGSVKMDLKTQKENAILLYNTGPPSRSDFIALEISDGKPRLILDKGNGAIDLNSTIYISDGHWHHLEAHFSTTYMELSVDDHIEDQPTHLGHNKFFDLSSLLYIGGLEINRLARAVKQGARNADKSLEGCIRKLQVDDRPLSIRASHVTSGIQADCHWAYPCLKNPCVDGATCMQEGTDGFKCICDMALCVRQNFTTGYKVFTKTTLPFDLEVLSLEPVEVTEGGQALLTSQHLHLELDYAKYGVRESGVLFHVITRPSRGHLAVNIWRRPEDNVFTLLDLDNDRVTYNHDGSETTEDSIVLELELVTRTGYILPSYLQARHRFVLPIVVHSQNDPPVLMLPPGKVLRLAKGTTISLNKDVLNAKDSDSSPSKLRYTVLNQKPEEGYLESSTNPGTPIHSFSQEDVNDGAVSYVHRGDSNTKIALKVSDGVQSSEPTILRIAAFDLQVYMVNNTGLQMTHDSSSLITAQNLSYNTNSPDQQLEIRFDITGYPRYGSLQRLRGNDRWQNINQFTSRQLEKEKIRYLHTNKEPNDDEFRFKISAGDHKFPTEYTFRVSFVAVTVEVVRNEELLIDIIQESFISEGFLQSITKPNPSAPLDIVYSIISSPLYGDLFLSSGDHTSQMPLKKGGKFTQEDIDRGRIKYKLHKKSYSPLHDTFKYKVYSSGRSSDLQIFSIRHTPPPLDADIILERLEVKEGGKKKITKKVLYIEAPGISQLIYNITSSPKHGQINVNDESMIIPERYNTTYFTSHEIITGSVYYQHDDSETTMDSFDFVAVSEDNNVDFQYVGTMIFKILNINDNHPLRVMEKVLNVVTNSERVVTSDDLHYIDPDLDTTAADIQYTRNKVPNGEFYHVEDRSKPIYVFTQDDIDQRRIVFRHKGPLYSKAVISVTDGELSSTSILEIVASQPFVDIVNNSGIIVPRGLSAVISNYNLSVETNMNAWGNAVVYLITQPPRFGNLNVLGKVGSEQFTEVELKNSKVKYENKGGLSFKDEFRFQVQVGKTTTEGIFEIKVYPESYWEALTVLNNNTVQVEEGSRVSIDQAALQIQHPNIAPSDITYVVVKRPQYGFLEIDLGDSSIEGPDGAALKTEVLVWDQSLINEGRVQYVEEATNVTSDHFVFDVTNGISTIERLTYNIQVIPKTIYLLSSKMQVQEGSRISIPPGVVKVLTDYYTDKIDQYLVAVQPSAGQLELTSLPGRKVEAFTQGQLSQGLLMYVHDGTEKLMDQFSLVAVAGVRQSTPAQVNITVIPINDEAPFVTNNTGLTLWEGSTVPMTSEMLAINDPDTPPSKIEIRVGTPDSGFLFYKNNPSHPLTTFTQEGINKGEVYFTHTGSKEGMFRFEATDQVHGTGSHVFQVTARQLKLKLINNEALHVFPMMQQPISLENLLTVTNDYDHTRSITFVIRRAPKLGKLLLLETNNNGARPVEDFTQRQINESRIVFEHTSPINELSAGDSFIFDVETPFTDPLKALEFSIEISVSGVGQGGLERFLGLAPLVVVEGGDKVLNTDNLNLNAVAEFIATFPSGGGSLHTLPQLLTTIAKLPHNGILTLKGRNISEGDVISQRDVERGKVRYYHDHSDTTMDEMGVSIALADNGTHPEVLLFDGTLHVNITPVNDQPFTLITPSPKLIVVRHQGAVVTKDLLLTTDPDNSVHEIVYEVMQGPNHGKLIRTDNYSVTVQVFSQHDIDSELVLYVHDGSEGDDKMHFKVSDGKHKPKYRDMEITVLPLSLTLINNTAIPLKQSTSVAYITPDHLATKTNGNQKHIFYNVTRQPRFGQICLNEHAIHTFGQVNINKGEISYIQTDLSQGQDTFRIDIWTWEAVLQDVEVRIVIMPLVEMNPLIAAVGLRTRLTLEHLDASQLAATTGSNPIYKIKRRPRFGKIKKVTRRTRRSGRSYEVHEFTHEDVRAGLIQYVARNFDLRGSEPLHDLLHYIIHVPAPDVQPAEGILRFTLVESVEAGIALKEDELSQNSQGLLPPSIQGSIPSGPIDSSQSNTGLASIPGLVGEYMIVVLAAVAVVIAILCVVVAVRCATRRRHHHDKRVIGLDADVASLPPPVPSDSRPNSYMTDDMSDMECTDDIPASPRTQRHMHSHHIHHNGSSGGGLGLASHLTDSEVSWPHDVSREVTPAVPHCKVTPLCNEGVARESPFEQQLAGYPYGIDSEQPDEWGIYDKHSPRTTNPMLRKNQYWV
ncbi:unnamed protein product [Meganyctiphanes norvegica]|uniref:Laminin G domain-containing protein n=1 Tax=Meganyctiphanes norvegica TaxID=48144 RepID=A0AAV2Q160_MEGNR